MGRNERAQDYLQLVEEVESRRRAALREMDGLIKSQYGSRRRFFERVLPWPIITVVTWGRWITGQSRPSFDKLKELTPYLREHLEIPDIGILDELLAIQSQEEAMDEDLGLLLDVAPLEQVRAMVDAAVVQANQAEFPPGHVHSAARRRSAIVFLRLLARLMESDEPDKYLFGAEAGVTLALLLAETGDQLEAKQQSLSAAYCLDQVLSEEVPSLRPVGYEEEMTWGELLVIAYQRTGTAESNLAEEDTSLFDDAERHFRQALQKAQHCRKGRRWQARVHRDLANLLLKQGKTGEAKEEALICLKEFAKMKEPDDPILYYVSSGTMASIALASSRISDARYSIREAKSVEGIAHPGPIHRVLLMQQEAALQLAEKEVDGWLATLGQAIDTAYAAGLTHQLRRVERRLRQPPAAAQGKAEGLIQRLASLLQVSSSRE